MCRDDTDTLFSTLAFKGELVPSGVYMQGKL